MSKFVLTAQLQLQAPTNTSQVVSQMQQQLQKGVNVKVNVQQGKQATKTVQDLSKATKQAGDRAAAMGRSFAVSFKRFAAFSLATRTVGLFTRGLSDAVGEALDFERQLIKVAQVTGKSVSELSSLTREVRALATGLGVSSQKLLEVSRILAQAGLSADQTRVALESLAKSSLAATFDDIIQTTEGAVAIFNQFGQGAAALEGQLGAINAVAGQFAVEAGDLIAVIRRTGGVFKAAGGDLNELIALFTSVRSTTRESAESIATGLRTIFTRIQRPTTIRYLEDLGIKLTDAQGKFVGGYEAIRLLSEALKDLPAGDLRFIRIAEQLGGFRQIGKIIPLLSQFGVAEEALNVALEGTNSLTEDAATAQGALLVRITQVKEQFLEFVAGLTAGPTFQILVNGALSLASSLLKVADAVQVLAPLLTALTMIKIGGALSGFGAGFLGGGKGPRAFASGGLVPGTGNRDSVPAMLTPGEYVIRKSSVGKIGTDNLAAMNSGKGYASGGSIVGQSSVGTVSADIFKPMKMKLPPQSAGSLFDKNPDNAFAFPGGYKKSSIKGSITKRLGASNPQLQQALSAANRVVTQGAASLPTETIAQGLGSNLSQSFDDALDDGILAAVEATSTGFMKKAFGKGKDFKYKSSIAKDDMSKAFNAGAKGSIFEMVVASIAGAPLDNIKNTTMPFDFTSGIGKLSSVYNKINMPYVDAKITGKVSGKDVKIDPTTGDVQNLSKNVKPEEIAKKVGNQFIMDIADEAHVAAMQIAGQGKEGAKFFGGAIKKYATGGAVSDTVPAMLTPGEYVINKDSAQSIGKSNLDRMNKRGVTGFAKGGAVGGVQHFALGGGAMAIGAGAAMAPAMVEQVFGPLSESASAVMDKFTQLAVILTGLHVAKQRYKASLVGAGAQAEMNRSGDAAEAIASQNAAAATLKFANVTTKSGAKTYKASVNLETAQRKNIGALNRQNQAIEAAHAKLVKQGASQNQLNAQIQVLKNNMNVASKTIKASLNPGDTKIFRNALKIVSQSTNDVGLKMKRMTQFMDSFTNATTRGKSAEDAATASLKSMKSELKSTDTNFKRFRAGLQSVNSVLKNSVTSLKGFIAGLNEKKGVQNAEAAMMGLAMAASILGEAFRAEAEQTANEALERGGLGGRTGDNVNDFDIARGTVDTQVAGAMFADAGDKAMMFGIIGTAVAGPIGAIIGMLGGLIFSYLNFDPEAERKKLNDKYAKAELSALKDRHDKELQAIKDAGKVTEEELTNIAKDFGRQKTLLDDIINEGDREKATKELDASILNSAATMGGLAKNQAHLDSIVQQLQDSYSEDIANVRDAAQSAFNLAQAAKAASEALYDAATVSNVFGRASLGVNNFVKSLETGSSRLGPAIKTLEESMKNFAMGDMAMDNVTNLRKEAMGSLGRAGIAKTSPAAKALDRQFNILQKTVQAQQNLPVALKNMSFTAGQTDEGIKDTIVNSLMANLGVGADDPIGKAILGSVSKLSEGDLREIRAGTFDFSKFIDGANKNLANLGKGAMDALKALEQHEATIAKLTKKRIKAEGELLKAQRSAIDAHLEAAEIMAEFGGAAVTGEMRKQATLDKSNLATKRLGLGELSSGSASELAAMSQAITTRFAALEIRGQTAGQFAGAAGLDADKRKELVAAQKDLVSTTKALIDLNREELELLKKKNALEKESLEAAIKGDLEKFLKDSMSVGATAAIAVGNEQLAGQLFGAEGVAGAFENIQSMAADGVQSIFGQQIGGQGGVAERGAAAALGMRGIEDPRMAALLAGTTAEEESLKAQNRALAGTLSTIADGQTTMAEMQVQSAQIAIDNANVIFNKELAAGNAQLLSRGGVVYAANGFEPRGTDTVPAMLTPGEVVVNKAGVNRGGNRGILRRMNRGEDVGGGGQMIAAIDPGVVKQLITGLNNFNTSLSQNIDKLKNTKFQIKLDTTNVNVNLNGGNFLAGLKAELKNELMADVGEKIKTLRFDDSGNASFSESSM